jgi:uncharacterized protein YehS (DUF1456 family)
MTNNDIIRRIRYLFNFNDQQVADLFLLANEKVSKELVSGWLKKEEDPTLIEISDRDLAVFLNGLIILKRGKREGPQPEPENPLSNNMILKKIKIALNLTSDDMLDLFASIGKPIGKHELSAFFRNPDHRKYQPCLDQYLRNFLNALQANYKG